MDKEQYSTNTAKKQRKIIILFILLLLITMTGTYFNDYYSSTGLLPIFSLNNSKTILTPELHITEQTYDQVMEFIKDDDTDSIEYSEGFNCVDASFRLWRNAAWKGIGCYLIKIMFKDSETHHMEVVFPTIDKGDIIIDPPTDIQGRPRVGELFFDKVVSGIYVLDIICIPVDGSPELANNSELE
jgi:hypothetical protein